MCGRGPHDRRFAFAADIELTLSIDTDRRRAEADAGRGTRDSRSALEPGTWALEGARAWAIDVDGNGNAATSSVDMGAMSASGKLDGSGGFIIPVAIPYERVNARLGAEAA